MRKVFLIIYALFLITLTFGGKYSAEFPINNWNQQHPESAWGAVFIKNISTRVINNKIVAVNSYKIDEISSSPSSEFFRDVSGTYAVDYNNDGFADIVSVTYGGKVIIKENRGFDRNGNLILKDKFSYNLPKSADGTMIVDDFDNDGKLDLFVYNAWGYAQYVSNAISNSHEITKKFMNFYYNDVKTMWTLSAMVTYDYNNDGYKDIIYADMRGRVWAWINDPSKGNKRFFNERNLILLFQDKDTFGTSYSNGGAVIDLSDINKDGIPDIIAGNTDKKNVAIYFGKMVNNNLVFDKNDKLYIVNSDGSLGPTTKIDSNTPNSKSPRYLPSFAPTIIKITDVDRDGYKDIFVGTDAWRQGKNFGGSIYLFKGTEIVSGNKPEFVSIELVKGSYSWENNPPYDFDAGTVADLDNDGVPDFIAADGNHSGNYYKVMTKTIKKYITDYGYIISDYIPKLVGILPKDLPNNFIKKIIITIEFDTSLGEGEYEIRYIKSGIKDPRLIDVEGYPLVPSKDSKGKIKSGAIQVEIEFNKPVPDPQIIIILKPENEYSAPHLKYLKYEVETAPSQVIIKGFNWNKGE